MVRQTLKISQQMLQDFQSMYDHFGTLRIKGLKKNYIVCLFSENYHFTLLNFFEQFFTEDFQANAFGKTTEFRVSFFCCIESMHIDACQSIYEDVTKIVSNTEN